MNEEKQIISKEKTAEAMVATTIAKEADSIAREAQMEAVLERVIKKQFEVEDSQNEGNKRFINLGRVPLICQSIIGIDARLSAIEGNIVWGVRIVIGAIILGLISILWK